MMSVPQQTDALPKEYTMSHMICGGVVLQVTSMHICLGGASAVTDGNGTLSPQA